MTVELNEEMIKQITSKEIMDIEIQKERERVQPLIKEDCEGEDTEYVLIALESSVYAKCYPCLDLIITAEEYLRILKTRDYKNDITLSSQEKDFINTMIIECEQKLHSMKILYKKYNPFYEYE